MSSTLAAAIAEQAPVAVVVADGERIVFANAQACALFLMSRDELMAQHALAALFEREGHGRLMRAIDAAANASRPADALELTGVRADGALVELEVRLGVLHEDGRPLIAAFISSLSERKRMVRSLARLAFNDPLTGLASRALVLDRLNQALRRGKREQHPFALIFLDLDDFKAINDQHGHDVGDEVLKLVGERLLAQVRGSDTIGRLGGDEFAVLLDGADRSAAQTVADKLLHAVMRPVAVSGHGFQLGASAGIALYPEHGSDMQTLIMAADTAMYVRKRNGKGSHGIHEGQVPNSCGRGLFLAWPEELELGLPEIDAQHRQLTERTNAVMAAISSAESPDVVEACLAELLELTRLHFATEEDYLRAALPEEVAQDHARQHRRLIAELEALQYDWEGHGLSHTIQYMRDWLVLHIRHWDRGLARQAATSTTAEEEPSRGREKSD